MADDEVFEYKSDVEDIYSNDYNNFICDTEDIKCHWTCEVAQCDDDPTRSILHFSWEFNWEELKRREGIDRLAGHIILRPSTEEDDRGGDFVEQRIDVYLREPHQTVRRDIRTQSLDDYLVVFEYSLTPHYDQIEEVEEEDS